MVVMNLFPAGVLQLADVLQNGYWHARGPEYMNAPLTVMMEWLRLPADLIFILLGVVPMLIAGGRAWGYVRKMKPSPADSGVS
jgi:nitric oxide reductase subunit B